MKQIYITENQKRKIFENSFKQIFITNNQCKRLFTEDVSWARNDNGTMNVSIGQSKLDKDNLGGESS